MLAGLSFNDMSTHDLLILSRLTELAGASDGAVLESIEVQSERIHSPGVCRSNESPTEDIIVWTGTVAKHKDGISPHSPCQMIIAGGA